VWAWW